MARQQAARRPSDSPRPVTGVLTTPQGQSVLLRFDPELAVRAIRFHLADEGISPRVDEPSAKATVARLRRAAAQLTVEQWIWAEMTNAQRLEWLMTSTHTVARLASDETSILEPAQD